MNSLGAFERGTLALSNKQKRTKGAKVEQRRIVRGAGLRARGGKHGVGAGEILGAQVLRPSKERGKE
jgi:hypothetical protein